MGELKVPADALWGAQTQRAVENFPISGLTHAARLPARARPREVGGGAKRTSAWACCRRTWPTAIRAAARSRSRTASATRIVPDRRIPDRLGHEHQHERQRGRRQPREPRDSDAPVHAERSRQHEPEQQRRDPDCHSRERRARGAQRADAGARASRATTIEARARELAGRRDHRAHAPDGRGADHARSGARRLGGAAALRPRAAAVRRSRGFSRSRRAAPPSAPGSTRIRSSRTRFAAALAQHTGLDVPAERGFLRSAEQPGRRRRAAPVSCARSPSAS